MFPPDSRSASVSAFSSRNPLPKTWKCGSFRAEVVCFRTSTSGKASKSAGISEASPDRRTLRSWPIPQLAYIARPSDRQTLRYKASGASLLGGS